MQNDTRESTRTDTPGSRKRKDGNIHINTQKNKKRRKTMKKIVFNDSRQIEVQSVTESDGVLHIGITKGAFW